MNKEEFVSKKGLSLDQESGDGDKDEQIPINNKIYEPQQALLAETVQDIFKHQKYSEKPIF